MTAVPDHNHDHDDFNAPASVAEAQNLLRAQDYIADRGLAIAIFLALKLQRPLFLEGEAGVGKTEIARALAAGLRADLIRLQCYEGLDVNHAVYEWNHARQLLAIRLLEARRGSGSAGGARRRQPTGRRRILTCSIPGSSSSGPFWKLLTPAATALPSC